MNSLIRFAVVASLGLGLVARAQLSPLTNPAILSYATVYPNMAVTNIFDGNPSTEYATQNQATNTFIIFDFGTPTLIAGFMLQQRHDNAMVATSELLFSNTYSLVSPFTSSLATVTLNHTVSQLAADTFTFTTPIMAQYVDWQVLSIPNNGLDCTGVAEMAFYTTAIPEPSTYAALLGLTTLGFAAFRRRHRQVG